MHPTLRHDLDALAPLLGAARDYALDYLQRLDARPVAARVPDAIEPLALPDDGLGGERTLALFRERFDALLSASPGARYLGFVTGGSTPAALMGDWLVGAFDQNAQLSGDTVAPHLEQQALEWLRDLLGLAPDHTGLCVTGATMSNFTGLAIGRQWLGEQRGVDLARAGLQAMPPIRVLSGAPHSSVLKALAMLGIGHDAVERLPCRPGSEAVDVDALARRLRELGDAPVIVVGNAGVVNNGDFDDLAAIAALRREHAFWFHVDGAFGLVAAVSPRFATLTRGVEHADSVTVDGHKWLNVPYDGGYVFTRHLETQLRVFQNISPYLGAPLADPRNTLHLGPENSRRWRALPLWFTLLAYGRAGVRDIVERDCAMAGRFAEAVVATPGLRLAAPVRLNIVCFTLEGEADLASVKRLQQRLADTGELFVTPSVYLGQPVLRAAFSNWRTDIADVERMRVALARALA